MQAVSVMTDTRSYETGELEEDVVEDAKTLKESLEIPYPVLIPDDNLFAVMSIISYFPTFFVVDSDGNHRLCHLRRPGAGRLGNRI